MRMGDSARGRLAIGVGPGSEQPIRRIQATGVVRGDDCRALACGSSQDRVDETRECAVATLLHECDGRVDRSMWRRAQKQALAERPAKNVSDDRSEERRGGKGGVRTGKSGG